MSGLILPFSAPYDARVAPVARGFFSYKCEQPIPYTRRVARDALVQATLEPDISCLAPLGGGDPVPQDAFFAFIATTQGKRCAVELCDKSNGLPFERPTGCDAAIAINVDSILAEPVLATARMIWSRRDELVPPGFILRLLKRLAAAADGVRLIDLEDELLEDPAKWVDFTLAMVCRGLVAIDYRKQLTHETVIRLGPTAGDKRGGPYRRPHWLD